MKRRKKEKGTAVAAPRSIILGYSLNKVFDAAPFHAEGMGVAAKRLLHKQTDSKSVRISTNAHKKTAADAASPYAKAPSSRLLQKQKPY